MTETTIEFPRAPIPKQFCNIERLLLAMEARGLDGIVATTPYNVYYLSGFNGIAHKADEPRPYAVVLSRHAPDHPVLVLADYYVGSAIAQPSWIEDVRAFRAVMLPLDLPPRPDDIDRFVPREGEGLAWVDRLRAGYSDGFGPALTGAIADLGLANAAVGFDDLRVGGQLPFDGRRADAYDTLMDARAIKTEAELALLRRATKLNERAIYRAIDSWDRGMSWREFNRAYHRAVIDLGGFIRDPGAMVWGHPRGGDAAITLQTGLEDFTLEPGTHVLFDCHGTLDLYCWDGGKTWIVEGESTSAGSRNAAATARATEAVLDAMRPGARVSELQAIGREAFRKAGGPAPDRALVFFHGLGLSHMDLPQATPDGQPNVDWMLEENMVVPVHVLCPGGERERVWVEEVAQVTPDGGKPFFSWGFDPIAG